MPTPAPRDTPRPGRSRSRLAWLAVAAAGLAVTLVAIALSMRRDAPASPAIATAAPDPAPATSAPPAAPPTTKSPPPTVLPTTARSEPPATPPPSKRGEPPAISGDGLPRLLIPVEGVRREQLRDSFDERRGGRRHEAIDIAAPRGTPVFAVDDGSVAKLFTSVPGGLTVYHFDPGGRFSYYYAHLDRYAEGLREGMTLRRGELIGYVGSTGNAAADSPHLHFAVFRLGPERQWWKGEPLNPFAAFM